jgi:hypothetical protein
LQQQNMTNGLRVRVVRLIDLFPAAKVEPGLLGTVHLTGGDGETEPYCMVKLDQTVPGLTQWSNRLQVWLDMVPVCTADDFEPIVVEA